MQKAITPYEKKSRFINQAKDLLDKLDELSRLHSIPYFFSAAIANSETDTEYLTRCRSSLPMGLQLADDNIVDFEKICAGFETYVPSTLPNIEL